MSNKPKGEHVYVAGGYAFDGHVIGQRGHVPGKVQGGYKPSSNAHASPPPSGGSAVKQPPSK